LSPQLPEEQQNSQEKKNVANPVDDKGFAGRYGICVVLIPKAYEEIRAEPHSLPTDVQEDEVIGHDQQQHEKDKKIEIGEIAGHALVVAHVSEGIDVNQKADARDDEEHDRRQDIDSKGKFQPQRIGFDPEENAILQRSTRWKKPDRPEGKEKRDRYNRTRKKARISAPQARTQKNIDRRPHKRNERDQAQKREILDVGGHIFSKKVPVGREPLVPLDTKDSTIAFNHHGRLITAEADFTRICRDARKGTSL